MKPTKAVFDTNIYIRGLLNPNSGAMRLLRIVKQKRLDLYTSRGQLAELTEVVEKYFSDPRERRYIPEHELDKMLDMLARWANLIPTTKVNKVSPDADDDYIIGIAIKAKVNLLVTENSKDIDQAIMPKNPPIEVLSIKEALRRLTPKQ